MRTLRGVVVWSVILEVATGLAPGAKWVEANNGLMANINPGLKALAIDRSGSTLYALNSVRGIFKSTDTGSTWRLLGGITGVLGLALDPNSPSTVYAGTSHGVRISSDGGENWGEAKLRENPVYALAVDPMTPSNVYAVAAGTIFKSTDGGTVWSMLNLAFHSDFGSSISAIRVDPTSPSTIYVVGGGSALYKSTDGGESWMVANDGHFSSWLQIAASYPSILYAIRAETGLSRSTDGGTTWTSINFGPTVQSMASDPSNPAILYAGIAGPNLSGQAIYKSTNGGQSWTLINTTIPVTISMTVDPANSSNVYAMSYDGRLFTSADGGTTWNNTSASLHLFDIAALSVDTTNPASIYAGGEAGVFKSSDGGANWQTVAAFQVAMGFAPPGFPPPNVPIPGAAAAAVRSLLLDPQTPGTLYTGTHRVGGCFFADEDFFKSTDGGLTWSSGISPENTGCVTDGTLLMDPSNSSTLYMPLGDIYVYGNWLNKSTDGGATWNATSTLPDDFHSLVIDPANPAILYAATGSGVLSSVDGGYHWGTAGLMQNSVRLLAIDPVHTGVIYAVTTSGLVKTTDRGVTWSPIANQLHDILALGSANALSIDPIQSDVLYLATSGYGVFKSSDGGITWAAFNDGLTQLDVRAITILHSDSVTLVAGTPGGIFKLVEDR